MNKAAFLNSISHAADQFLTRRARNKGDVMMHDGDILSVAQAWGLKSATGSPHQCPISRAIVTAAWDRDNPLRVIADVEAAWEHYRQVSVPAQAA